VLGPLTNVAAQYADDFALWEAELKTGGTLCFAILGARCAIVVAVIIAIVFVILTIYLLGLMVALRSHLATQPPR
jgi:hypothetical protein